MFKQVDWSHDAEVLAPGEKLTMNNAWRDARSGINYVNKWPLARWFYEQQVVFRLVIMILFILFIPLTLIGSPIIILIAHFVIKKQRDKYIKEHGYVSSISKIPGATATNVIEDKIKELSSQGTLSVTQLKDLETQVSMLKAQNITISDTMKQQIEDLKAGNIANVQETVKEIDNIKTKMTESSALTANEIKELEAKSNLMNDTMKAELEDLKKKVPVTTWEWITHMPWMFKIIGIITIISIIIIIIALVIVFIISIIAIVKSSSPAKSSYINLPNIN